MAELNNVVNLYVFRQARIRDVEEGRLIWICSCGCKEFYYYDIYGLRCAACDKWNTPRAPGGNRA